MNIMKLTLIFILLFALIGYSKEHPRDKNISDSQSIAKTSLDDITLTLLNAGNWGYWARYDGQSAHNPDGNSGGFYPRGTAAAVYQDGLVWGAWFENDPPDKPVRVGGFEYVIGTTPGWIEPDGQPVSSNDPRLRMYRIRTDYKDFENNLAGLVKGAAEFYSVDEDAVTTDQLQDIYDQYESDYMNWPADLGAPFVDVDADGTYDPDVDTPGLANADQVTWFVVNDLNAANTAALYGTDPIGIELQATFWAYNQPNSTLGQIIFKKYKFINKGSEIADSMFVAIFSDPDVGTYTDDFVGCDIEQSIGFAYSGFRTDDDYASFGLPPAAVGYDFFQGPLVDGVAGQDINANGVDDAEDYGVFDLKRVGPGKVNLPMTSFVYFAAGSPYDDPSNGEYDGAKMYYNMLNGYTPTPDLQNPTPYTIGSGAGAGEPTKFPLSGDPFFKTGDLDGEGTNFAPGDRRIVLSSGPFTLAPGDTQEVVVAVVGGIIRDGGDNRNAVSQMKLNDRFAQFLYNNLFEDVPRPPSAPDPTWVEVEGKIGIEWQSNSEAVAASEAEGALGYKFEGYNVYQLPSPNASLEDGVKIATYDVINGVQIIRREAFLPSFGDVVTVPIQNGTDSGIKRHIQIGEDYLTGGPLLNGTTYYFAVTAYNFVDDPTSTEPSLESNFELIQAIPQGSDPKGKVNADPGSELEVFYEGPSDGEVLVTVIDPKLTTGDDYEVFFETDDDTNSATYGELVWNVRNGSGTVVLANQPQASSLDESDLQPFFDGLQVKVSGPNLIVKDWDWEDTGDVSPLYPDYEDGRWISGEDWGGNALFGGLGMAHIFWAADPGVDPGDFVDVEIRFTHMVSYDDTSGDGEYTFGENGGEAYTFDITKGQKAFMYETWDAGNYLSFSDVPFQAWDVSDPNNPRQLNVVVRDRDTNGQWDLGTGDGPYNYVWIMEDDYDPTGAAWDASTPEKDFMDIIWNGPGGGAVPAYYVLWGVQRGSRPFLARDGVLSVIPAKVNTENDIFSFTAPVFEQGADIEEESVKKVSVFPNPYYAANTQETSRFNTFVTFVHLPQKVTIRIFDLGGIQVRKLEKDNDSQFIRWDLLNEEELPVASGMYIAHIDMGDLGEKVLKLMIIQGQQILRFY